MYGHYDHVTKHQPQLSFHISGDVRVFSQKLGTRDVKDSNGARGEATGENLLAGMEGHRARTVLRHKIKQLKDRKDN